MCTWRFGGIVGGQRDRGRERGRDGGREAERGEEEGRGDWVRFQKLHHHQKAIKA